MKLYRLEVISLTWGEIVLNGGEGECRMGFWRVYLDLGRRDTYSIGQKVSLHQKTANYYVKFATFIIIFYKILEL